jgi:hypothetical protein
VSVVAAGVPDAALPHPARADTTIENVKIVDNTFFFTSFPPFYISPIKEKL